MLYQLLLNNRTNKLNKRRFYLLYKEVVCPLIKFDKKTSILSTQWFPFLAQFVVEEESRRDLAECSEGLLTGLLTGGVPSVCQFTPKEWP